VPHGQSSACAISLPNFCSVDHTYVVVSEKNFDNSFALIDRR